MEYFLAIDGGGTKTKALCADEQRQVVGEGLAGPTNLTATNVGAASFNLREAIRQATEHLPQGWRVTKMVMGLAGMDTQAEAENARQVFGEVLKYYPIDTFVLVNDIVIALASGSNHPDAVALISGTGSNCYGRNAEGQEVKVGGMDFLLTDQGSGYEIGRYVLRTAVKSFDGRVEKTVLEQLVCEHFHIGSIGELKNVVYNPLLTKPEVAELAKECEQALHQGDKVAQEIFDHVVEELMSMITTAVRRLGIAERQVDLVLAGGVCKIGYIGEQLQAKVRALYPMMQVIYPDKEPVYGALKLALEKNV